MSDSFCQDLSKEHHAILFGVRRSIRYHSRRRSYYDHISKSAAVLSAIGGSATIIALLSTLPQQVAITFAASVACLSAVNLVVSPAQAARAHHDFVKAFIALEKDLVAIDPARMTLEQYNAHNSARLDIEAQEPPVLSVLNTICHNELVRAMGYGKDQLVKISCWQRWSSNFLDLGEHNLCTK